MHHENNITCAQQYRNVVHICDWGSDSQYSTSFAHTYDLWCAHIDVALNHIARLLCRRHSTRKHSPWKSFCSCARIHKAFPLLARITLKLYYICIYINHRLCPPTSTALMRTRTNLISIAVAASAWGDGITARAYTHSGYTYTLLVTCLKNMRDCMGEYVTRWWWVSECGERFLVSRDVLYTNAHTKVVSKVIYISRTKKHTETRTITCAAEQKCAWKIERAASYIIISIYI